MTNEPWWTPWCYYDGEAFVEHDGVPCRRCGESPRPIDYDAATDVLFRWEGRSTINSLIARDVVHAALGIGDTP